MTDYPAHWTADRDKSPTHHPEPPLHTAAGDRVPADWQTAKPYPRAWTAEGDN
ncbi:hypothetical protein ACPXB3_05805 [Gordonia sp. DT219]|uniref:hypothetical protein n=1 Tax=Gordonia sp. DT219 TaxID=3416658 RepID=UPI003CEF151E